VFCKICEKFLVRLLTAAAQMPTAAGRASDYDKGTGVLSQNVEGVTC
jgi:hypothetical protein